MGSRESYFGSVSRQNNINNPLVQDQEFRAFVIFCYHTNIFLQNEFE